MPKGTVSVKILCKKRFEGSRTGRTVMLGGIAGVGVTQWVPRKPWYPGCIFTRCKESPTRGLGRE